MRAQLVEPSGRQRGFTLIEMMVVISLVGILAAIAVPSFTTLIANNRVTSAAQELQTLLQYSRAEAVYKRTDSSVTVSGQTWSAKSGTTVLRETVVPTAVTITPASADGVTFDLNGMAKPGAGTAPYKVKVSADKASRVQCLSVTGAGLVRQQRVASGSNCP